MSVFKQQACKWESVDKLTCVAGTRVNIVPSCTACTDFVNCECELSVNVDSPTVSGLLRPSPFSGLFCPQASSVLLRSPPESCLKHPSLAYSVHPRLIMSFFVVLRRPSLSCGLICPSPPPPSFSRVLRPPPFLSSLFRAFCGVLHHSSAFAVLLKSSRSFSGLL